jgi:hypothetical protein
MQAVEGMPVEEPKRNIIRLIFVYDADSGRIAAVADSFKKLLGKGCPLCAVTHGLTKKREQIVAFEQCLSIPVSYLHRDEVQADPIARGHDRPCILAEVEGEQEPVVLLDPRSIERLRGTERDLKGRLLFRAAALGLDLPVSD